MKLPVVCILVALALPASTVAAQGSAIPRVAISLEAGAGSHSMRSGDTYFRDDLAETMLWAATVRVAQWGRVAPLIRVETQPYGLWAQTDDCPFAPNGTCAEHFPKRRGSGAAVGAMVSLTRWAAVGGMLGGQWHGGSRADLVEARALLTPFRYVGVTAAIRRLSFDHPEHGRLWMQPVIFGLQAQLP